MPRGVPLIARLTSAFIGITALADKGVFTPRPAHKSGCVAPGLCVEPASKFKRVLPIKPRRQWNIEGGFCGATSVQVMAMGHGAWISVDLVRKANIGAPCHGHNETGMGCEVGPENYGQTAAGLKLKYDMWDYSQPAPQAKAFKSWIKSHLVKGSPVMWAPICKGDSHTPYGPASCPGGGHFDHHEPLIGIGSNHPLSDATVYDDDWILHFSDQDLETYYRNISSLQDGLGMEGNCKHAQAGYGKNEMYPCFYDQVTYGLAINGLNVQKPTLRVNIDVDNQLEPNVRSQEKAVQLHATVQVHGLKVGGQYVLYRYASTEALPSSEFDQGYEHKTLFTATGETWEQQDPNPFLSDKAVYYVAVPVPSSVVTV